MIGRMRVFTIYGMQAHVAYQAARGGSDGEQFLHTSYPASPIYITFLHLQFCMGPTPPGPPLLGYPCTI